MEVFQDNSATANKMSSFEMDVSEELLTTQKVLIHKVRMLLLEPIVFTYSKLH